MTDSKVVLRILRLFQNKQNRYKELKEKPMLRWLKNMFRRLLNIISNIICAISRWLSNIVHKKTEERKKEKQERRKHEKVVCSFPNLIYSLPLIIMGFVFWPIDAYGWINSEKLGWIWLITILVTFLAMGLESFSWKMAGFWICVICACLWLRDVKHITIFDNVYNYLADLDIQYSRKAHLYKRLNSLELLN